MKTALVHDWLIARGGAEKVLQEIWELFPSPVYTLVKKGEWFPEVHTSFIQKLPFSTSAYRNYLPLFPRAIEQFDLSSYDLILSDSHAVAKGVRTHHNQLHICYCHTPMRYAWDLYKEYLEPLSPHKKLVAILALHGLKKWDLATTQRVDHFIANSHFIAERIQRVYGRAAEVIYPPVDVEKIPFSKTKEDFYLTAARLVSYKRIDLLVDAFAEFPKKRLLVIGEGPEMKELKRRAPSNVEFLGQVTDQTLYDLLGKAKAFLFAALEDFGILPVESQAAGTPVIAFGRGGALETVLEGKTGLFFMEQNSKSVVQAIKFFEKKTFDYEIIRHHAMCFNRKRFHKEYQSFVLKKWEQFSESHRSVRR